MVEVAWSSGPFEFGATEPFFCLGGIRYCEACILLYDVTDRRSFEALEHAYGSFHVQRSFPSNIPGLEQCSPFRGLFFVIGNKIDLPADEWEVSIQEAEEFSARIGAVFFQMSAKTGQGGGREAMEDIVNHVLLRRIEVGIEEGQRGYIPQPVWKRCTSTPQCCDTATNRPSLDSLTKFPTSSFRITSSRVETPAWPLASSTPSFTYEIVNVLTAKVTREKAKTPFYIVRFWDEVDVDSATIELLKYVDDPGMIYAIVGTGAPYFSVALNDPSAKEKIEALPIVCNPFIISYFNLVHLLNDVEE